MREIRRRGDSVMNGLKIGILSGGAAGALGLAVASMLQNEEAMLRAFLWGSPLWALESARALASDWMQRLPAVRSSTGAPASANAADTSRWPFAQWPR